MNRLNLTLLLSTGLMTTAILTSDDQSISDENKIDAVQTRSAQQISQSDDLAALSPSIQIPEAHPGD